MKLYYIPGTCSLATHVALREIGADFDLELVNNETKSTQNGESYLEVNPKGYVAALRLDNGEVLTEGAAILLHLVDMAGDRLAPPPGTMARARFYELLIYVSTEIHQTFGRLFHPDSDEAAAKTRDKLTRQLDYLESTLDVERTWLLGEELTVADIYLFVVLRWSIYLSIDMSSWPLLTRFMRRVEVRPAVQDAMRAEGL